MSLINRCYNCSKNDIICENLQVMNIKLEYYDYCNDCIKDVKNILTVNLSLPIDLLNIILSLITLNDTIILDKNYNFISSLNTIKCIVPLVLGFGKPQGYKEVPKEIKSFNFVNKLLQKSDIASLFTVQSILFSKRKYYKDFRKDLIYKNKLEYIFINLTFRNTYMILLIFKPYEITTTINVIDYKNKNLIKTITANDIINNNYIIDI
jgi:hypothetical protein